MKTSTKSLTINFIWIGLILLVFIGIYHLLKTYGFVDLLANAEKFKLYLLKNSYWGIFLVIALMAFAILFKLLPSAAVALASGAAYGHTWGTIYIILGAWIGALIAFTISRILGNDALCQLLGRRIMIEEEKSQPWLMWGLLISRFIPVIPYDIVSYAMGITPIKFWRFSLATLVGLIPTSFFLAHVGSELVSTSFQEMLLGMLIAGLVLLLPVIILMLFFYRYGKMNHFLIIKKCEKNKEK